MPSSQTLVQAIQGGDLEQVKAIIQQQPELISARTETNVPVTLLAAYYRQPAVFEFLMEQCPHPTIYEATAAGLSDRVQQILKEKPEVLDAYAEDGFTALSLAAYFGQAAVARLLVEKGADVNRIANNGSRIAPLHAAVAADSEPITRLLLESGADVNLQQTGGVTALHSAAHRGNVALVKLLLDHGANTDLKMDDGRTALDFAAADGHEAVVALLR